MKKLFPLFLSLLILLSGISPIQADEESDSTSLRILFTNDLQDHVLPYSIEENGELKSVGGYSRLSSAIASLRNDNTVLVDGGNFSHGTVFQSINSSHAPDLSMLAAMGYDAIAIGDEEFTNGVQALTDMLNVSENEPKVLSSNIECKDTEVGNALQDAFNNKSSAYQIVEKGGYKVGIFSMIKDDTVNSADVKLTDDTTYAKEMVSSLQEEGVDYIIALVHGGDDFASNIAKSVDGIDTIVASCHTDAYEDVEEVNGVNIVSSGSNGTYVGVLDVSIENDVQDYQLVRIDDNYGYSDDMNNRISYYETTVDAQVFAPYDLSFHEVLATNAYNFTPIDHTSKDLVNNNTADLVTDAYAFAYNDWYDDWYDSWKEKRSQMLKAAQSIVDKQTQDGQMTAEGEEASKRIEEIKEMEPEIKQRAIGLISKKEIQSTFTQDSINAMDAYNVVPNGLGTDGSQGESLVLVFMKGKDIRALCEYDATVARKSEPENQLFFSGLKYTYNDYRGDYNHVEDVYVDAVNEYYVPVDNKTLYPVVTTLSLAKELTDLSNATNGKFSIRYFDENGGKILNLSANVLKYKKKELKSYSAIATYVSDLERGSDGTAFIPSSYEKAKQVKTYNNKFSFTSLFKNTTSTQLYKYMSYAITVVVVVIGYKLIRFLIQRRKQKGNDAS